MTNCLHSLVAPLTFKMTGKVHGVGVSQVGKLVSERGDMKVICLVTERTSGDLGVFAANTLTFGRPFVHFRKCVGNLILLFLFICFLWSSSHSLTACTKHNLFNTNCSAEATVGGTHSDGIEYVHSSCACALREKMVEHLFL